MPYLDRNIVNTVVFSCFNELKFGICDTIVIRKFHPRKFHPRKFHPRKFHPAKIPPSENSTQRKFHPAKIPPSENQVRLGQVRLGIHHPSIYCWVEFSLGGIFVGGIFVGGIFVGGIFVGGIFLEPIPLLKQWKKEYDLFIPREVILLCSSQYLQKKIY